MSGLLRLAAHLPSREARRGSLLCTHGQPFPRSGQSGQSDSLSLRLGSQLHQPHEPLTPASCRCPCCSPEWGPQRAAQRCRL